MNQLGLVGIAAVSSIVRNPSKILKDKFDNLECIEFILFDNDMPDKHTELINEVVGEGSRFHDIHGVYAMVRPHFDQPGLPHEWWKRMIQRSLGLNLGPAMYAISPTDFVLANLATDSPEKLINMELVIKNHVKTIELERRLESWQTLDVASSLRARFRIQDLQELYDQINPEEDAIHPDLSDAALALIADHADAAQMPSVDSLTNVLPITGRRIFPRT